MGICGFIHRYARVVLLSAISGILVLDSAVAGSNNVYVAYDETGAPSYANQPYNNNYALIIHANDGRVGPSVRRRQQIEVDSRREAMQPIVERVAYENGLDPALLSAIIDVESAFSADALSPKGAVGAMQLMPETAAKLGIEDPYDAYQNIDGGARFLKELLRANNGNLPLALAAYNAGRDRIVRHNQRIPPFQETMLYVPRVLAKMAEYRRERQKEYSR